MSEPYRYWRNSKLTQFCLTLREYSGHAFRNCVSIYGLFMVIYREDFPVVCHQTATAVPFMPQISNEPVCLKTTLRHVRFAKIQYHDDMHRCTVILNHPTWTSSQPNPRTFFSGVFAREASEADSAYIDSTYLWLGTAAESNACTNSNRQVAVRNLALSPFSLMKKYVIRY